MDALSQAYPYLPYLVVGTILIAFCLLIFLVFTLRKAQKAEPLGLAIEEGGAPGESAGEEKKSGLFSRYKHSLNLRTSFSKAIKFLRENVAGRDYLYQIPWYMVVGESGSGKTTLLASAGIRASLRDRAEDFGIHQAVQWRFFNQGIVLDVYGDYLLRPEVLTSDELGWEALLKQLQSHRARRPIDGVVIALPCTDFLGSNAGDLQALGTKAARLCDKLWRAQTLLGICFPIYVIVTKCDAIPGFRGFCQEIPSRSRLEIFGWSSPYSLATSFIPAWVDEAFESLVLDLHCLQCEIFAERGESRNADDVFMFPGEFQSMRDSLRIFLGRLFKETAYREAFFFRGLYFCGDASPDEMELAPLAESFHDITDPFASPVLDAPSLSPSALPQPAPRSPIFLTRLFEEKIFPESSIARPVSRVFRSQSRLVWVAQTVAALLAIGLAWGATARYHRMVYVEKFYLLPPLQTVAGEMRGPIGTQNAPAELGHSACYLTQTMLQLNMNVFSSAFIPVSLASTLNERVKGAMVPAFQKEVLGAVKSQLDFRATELSAPVPPAPPPAESSASGGGGLEDFKTYSVEGTPEFQTLRRFSADLMTLQQNINRYEALRRRGQGSSEDLRELADYLGCPIPPQVDIKHNIYIQSVLQEAVGDPFDERGQVSDRMSAKLAQLDQNFLNAWFAENPIWLSVAGLQNQISDLEDGKAGAYQDLKNLDERISLVKTLLSSPTFNWISKPNLDQAGSLCQATTEPIRNTKFFSPQLENSIRTTSETDFQNLKTKLETTDTDLTGDLLQSEGDALQLSTNTLALQLDLENVLNLPFMAMQPSRTFQADLEPRTHLMWNPDPLNEALSLYEAFDRFSAEGLRDSPPNLRAEFRHIAVARLESNMLDLIGHAQTYEPVTESEIEGPSATGNTAELKSFEDAEAPLSQILDVFRKLALSGSYSALQRLTTAQASNLLAGLDAELKSEQPYSAKNGNFFWWHGQGAPALLAFDVQTPQELEGYLTFQRQRLEALSTQADPLINFLAGHSSSLSDSQARTYFQWRQIGASLKSYEQKIPGSPVADLQDFIRSDMNKFDPDQYCQGTAAGSSEAQSTNFFLQKRDDLRQGIEARCKYLADMAAYRNYSEVGRLFDRTLAGKFPFTLYGMDDPSSEADPAALQAFYQLFDEHESATHLALKLSSAFGPTRMPALSFLEQMESLRSVFSSLLSSGNAADVLALDFLSDFRVNEGREIGGNQIIGWTLRVGEDQYRDHEPKRVGRWKLGDPVRLTLRWAKDSPALPVRGKDQPDLMVEGREATFEYTDGWSLFRLLREHHAPAADFPQLFDPNPYTLEFTLGTAEGLSTASKKGIVVPTETKVFVQLSIMPPGKKESLVLPSFPPKAPLLVLAPPDE